jgi:hypothetical protein
MKLIRNKTKQKEKKLNPDQVFGNRQEKKKIYKKNLGNG